MNALEKTAISKVCNLQFTKEDIEKFGFIIQVIYNFNDCDNVVLSELYANLNSQIKYNNKMGVAK